MLGLSHDEQRGEDNDGQGNRPYAKVVEVPRGELLVLGKAASTRLAALCGDLLRHPTFGTLLRVEYLCCPAVQSRTQPTRGQCVTFTTRCCRRFLGAFTDVWMDQVR